MAAIKLFSLGECTTGVIRLQSQLYIGADTADFILENEVLKYYGHGKMGIDFYPYDGEYIIVEDIKEMQTQTL